MVMPRSRSMSIESSTCASISRSDRPPQRWMRRSASVDLAVVDVGDDGEVADVIHAVASNARWTAAVGGGACRCNAGVASATRCEGRESAACARLKKRHVESMTRLPTKRMATACWDFIVAKSTPRKPRQGLISLRCRAPTRVLSTDCPQMAVDALGAIFRRRALSPRAARPSNRSTSKRRWSTEIGRA